MLRFEGDAKVTMKAKKLVESALATTGVDALPNKKRKVSDPVVELDTRTGRETSLTHSGLRPVI